MIFELLTGHPPFHAREFASLAYSILNTPPPQLSEFRDDLPDGMQEIIDRTLAKRPQDRFGKAVDIADALRTIFGEIEDGNPGITKEEKLELVSALEFFRDFSKTEIREVVGTCGWKTYCPGEPIILEGSIDLAFYIIVSGVVSVEKNGATICMLNAGNCFGEMGFLAKSRRTATIKAADHVSLLILNSAVMRRTSVDCRLKFGDAFIRTLIERLAKNSEALVRTESQAISNPIPPISESMPVLGPPAPTH